MRRVRAPNKIQMSRKRRWLMSQTIFWLFTCTVFAILFAACSRSENKKSAPLESAATQSPGASQTDGAPADVVQANAAQVEISPGGKAEVSVTITIAQGYHINGNPTSEKFQIATELAVDSLNGITAGKALYPPSVSKKFSFSPDPIMVYEKEVVIRQPLQASADSAKGNHSLRARLQVQPCDDAVCYPPRSLPVTIPVDVK